MYDYILVSSPNECILDIIPNKLQEDTKRWWKVMRNSPGIINRDTSVAVSWKSSFYEQGIFGWSGFGEGEGGNKFQKGNSKLLIDDFRKGVGIIEFEKKKDEIEFEEMNKEIPRFELFVYGYNHRGPRV